MKIKNKCHSERSEESQLPILSLRGWMPWQSHPVIPSVGEESPTPPPSGCRKKSDIRQRLPRSTKERASLAMTTSFKKYAWILGLTFLLLNFLLPKIAFAATYADAAKQMCTKMKNIEDASAWAQGDDCLGPIGNTGIDVFATATTPINPQHCAYNFKQWIAVNSDCSSTIGSSSGLNVNTTYASASSSGTTTPASSTATTPAPAASGTAPAAAATSNTNWSGMSVNATASSQQDTDTLAVILSIIIGIMAITVPWGMMSEVTNAIKKITQPAWNQFKKTDTAKLATVPYHKARNWYARTKMGQKDLKRHANLEAMIGSEKGEREAIEKTFLEDSQSTIRVKKAMRILGDFPAKGTPADFTQREVPDYAQDSILGPMANAGRESAQKFVDGLIHLDMNQFQRLMTGKLGGKELTDGTAEKLMGQYFALIQQSNNPNHPYSKDATTELEKLGRDVFNLPGAERDVIDQVKTINFKSGKIGPPIVRPDSPATFQNAEATGQVGDVIAGKINITAAAGGISSLSATITKNTMREIRSARLLNRQLRKSINSLKEDESLDDQHVIERLLTHVDEAQNAADNGNIGGAASHLRELGITDVDNYTRPEVLKSKIGEVRKFMEIYNKNDASRAAGETAAAINYAQQTRNNIIHNEQVTLINKAANTQLSPEQLAEIKGGNLTSIASLAANQQQAIQQVLTQLDAGITANADLVREQQQVDEELAQPIGRTRTQNQQQPPTPGQATVPPRESTYNPNNSTGQQPPTPPVV
jgi:hypothetical protein